MRLSSTAPGLGSAALKVWTALVDALRAAFAVETRSYRPEQYYMRGPGPKWRAKHARWQDS